ncbi:MAG TPA: hypothetical protein VFW38_06345 [Solirubrobacteraceae bacterium]|nr:hypothetical protein [Solirubrobacteraceae bacterium]
MQLFALFAIQADEKRQRDVAIATSRGRRDVALALGQVGNQLALALWRADELALAVRSARMCPDCAGQLAPAMQRFDDFPAGRHPPPSRILPVIGTVP